MQIDPLTGETFKPMRTNQKFASRANQIRFNNEQAKRRRNAIGRINKPILKNYKILSDLMSDKKEQTFHKQFLIGKGFNFGVHTHTVKIKDKICFAIIDFAFMEVENKEYVKINNLLND